MLVAGLEKAYSRGAWDPPLRALQGLWLGIGEGETFGLLGVNGAGKTTAFRLLTGASFLLSAMSLPLHRCKARGQMLGSRETHTKHYLGSTSRICFSYMETPNKNTRGTFLTMVVVPFSWNIRLQFNSV